MFTLSNQYELRKVTISSLQSCIYLPSIVTFISYKGLLYTVGKASSFYVLVLIFIAELLKAIYLNITPETQVKKTKNRNGAREIFKSFMFLLCTVFSFFIGIILFGAPFLDNHEETLMLSMLITLLGVFPLIAHAGVETSMQLLFRVKTFSKDSIVEMLIHNALLTVCGAWLGAVVIPLDWNTPWQVWPISCYLGAIGGYLLSNVITISKITLVSASEKYPALKLVVNVINKFDLSK